MVTFNTVLYFTFCVSALRSYGMSHLLVSWFSLMPWYFVNITARPALKKTIQNYVAPQTHDAFQNYFQRMGALWMGQCRPRQCWNRRWFRCARSHTRSPREELFWVNLSTLFKTFLLTFLVRYASPERNE